MTPPDKSVVATFEKVRIESAHTRGSYIKEDSQSVVIYNVVVETPKSSWHETFTSIAEVKAFARGLEAGADGLGHFGQIKIQWAHDLPGHSKG